MINWLFKSAISLNEPTYQNVIDLMKQTPKVEGNCCEKSKNIQDFFFKRGLQCYIVITNRSNGDGHISVAFNTKQGWKFYEPETHKEYPIAVGQIWNPVGIVFWGSQVDPNNRLITQMVIIR